MVRLDEVRKNYTNFQAISQIVAEWCPGQSVSLIMILDLLGFLIFSIIMVYQAPDNILRKVFVTTTKYAFLKTFLLREGIFLFCYNLL